ncbi:MAG: hypothetical protein OIF34_14370, partial [Porticoccaceae bacterium]|nr:hypothetical protein [Porticoccaceae bacterium]
TANINGNRQVVPIIFHAKPVSGSACPLFIIATLERSIGATHAKNKAIPAIGRNISENTKPTINNGKNHFRYSLNISKYFILISA